MTADTVEHPLTDAIGASWAATESRSPVVFLSELLADFLRSCAASSRRPVIVTGPQSRLTPAVAGALTAVGGRWVVRDEDRSLFDARSGVPLASPEDAFTKHRIQSLDDLAAGFQRIPAQNLTQLMVTVATRHRVSRPVALGGPSESLAMTFTGSAPETWGASEPFTAPWDRADLTERTRQRMPESSRWGVTSTLARPFASTITVERTSEGLEETTHAWIDRTARADEPVPSAPDDAIAALRAVHGHGMPLFATALTRIGASDLSQRASVELPPNPLALMIGPPGLRSLGRDVTWWQAQFGAITLGSPRLPSVIIPLGSPKESGWPALSRLTRSLDEHALARTLRRDGEIGPVLAAEEEG